jgi:large subunit ribosomal protein L23
MVFDMAEKNFWDIVKFPHLAEKSMNMVEMENKLVFIVDRRVNKDQIKSAVESEFNVKVEDVNIIITKKSQKKAYVKLSGKDSASDIASRMGML